MFQDAIEQAAYERARAARLGHAEALEEARIAAAQTRAALAGAQQAQADAANPQPVFDWRRYDEMERRTAAPLDAALATAAQRNARVAQLQAEIAALDREIAERPDPRVARRRSLVEELRGL